jgi:hypothetical protein
MPPLAHTGHALVDLAVYLGPVALALAWLGLSNRRARRRQLKEREHPRG